MLIVLLSAVIIIVAINFSLGTKTQNLALRFFSQAIH